jgi:AraC family transcriptional regulator of adaptative response / DNA-3-methyladenine glycosylase II
LRFRPPFQWQHILAFLAPRATPGVEAVEAGIYRRSISLGGTHGWFEVSLDEGNHSLAVRVQFSDPRSLFFICERLRAMFDLNADWIAIVSALRASPFLVARVDAAPGLRVPGCWDGFELATRAIIGQQISVKGATALAGRLVREFGKSPCFAACPPNRVTHIFPTPEILADGNLIRAGLTTARAQTIRALARAVCDRRISFEGVVDSDAFQARLCEIPGIGWWTAQYVAMRALGDPDAFPSSDLGLLRASGLGNFRDLESHAEAWRPWRAYGAMYLWSLAGDDRASRKSSLAGSRSSRGAPTAPRRITAAA